MTGRRDSSESLYNEQFEHWEKKSKSETHSASAPKPVEYFKDFGYFRWSHTSPWNMTSGSQNLSL